MYNNDKIHKLLNELAAAERKLASARVAVSKYNARFKKLNKNNMYYIYSEEFDGPRWHELKARCSEAEHEDKVALCAVAAEFAKLSPEAIENHCKSPDRMVRRVALQAKRDCLKKVTIEIPYSVWYVFKERKTDISAICLDALKREYAKKRD